MKAIEDNSRDDINQLEWQLGLLKRRFERLSLQRSASAASHLDRAAYVILGWLDEQGPARLSAIAAFFGLDTSTVSRQVAGLEEQGLIERLDDPNDGRAHQLSLTTTGRRRFTDARAERRSLLAEHLADWSAEDSREFTRLLHKYNQVMEARCATGTAAAPKESSD